MSKINSEGISINLSGTLFIILLVLKLFPNIVVSNWSWWWITSPLWIPVVIVLLFFTIMAIIYGIVAISKWVVRK